MLITKDKDTKIQTKIVYVTIPSIIPYNMTLLKSMVKMENISTSSSLLMDENDSSLKILGRKSFSTYFLKNATMVSQELPLMIPLKLQKDSHGYQGWKPNILYQFEQLKQNGTFKVNHLELDMDYYTTMYSASRNIPGKIGMSLGLVIVF